LSGSAGLIELSVEGQVYETLEAFCRTHQVTMFTVLLTAFRVTHYRLTGAEDATVGTPIANRNRPELENLIGFFVNTQCMRITVDRDETFASLVRQVRSTATAAYSNQDVPFERIVSSLLPGSRDTSRNPLVQLMFALHSQTDLGKIHLDGLEGDQVKTTLPTRFDLEFHLTQGDRSLDGTVLYSNELFEEETIRGMVTVFQEVLCRGLEEPQTPILSIPLTNGLADLRKMGLLELKQTDYPRDSSVVDVFQEQVKMFPDRCAVKDSSSARLTYAELDRQSDELAGWLRHRGMVSETLVGVLAPRSCQTIVAFLGILKASLAYLPLDVNVPAARVSAILSAVAGHKLVLLGSDVPLPALELPDVELVRIGDVLGRRQANGVNGSAFPAGANGAGDAHATPSPTSLAYAIFTSGSTGQPKGVMVEHRSIVRLVKQSNVVAKLRPAAAVAHLSNIAFDASMWEVYAALLNGGTLVCIDYLTSLDTTALGSVFTREQIRASMLPPALLKQCLDNNPAALKGLELLFVAGDRFDGHDAIEAQKLVPTGIFNAYGPTENTILSTIYNVGSNELFVNGVPIGQAGTN
jgi:non-ribosomal peptide synthetase component F